AGGGGGEPRAVDRRHVGHGFGRERGDRGGHGGGLSVRGRPGRVRPGHRRRPSIRRYLGDGRVRDKRGRAFGAFRPTSFPAVPAPPAALPTAPAGWRACRGARPWLSRAASSPARTAPYASRTLRSGPRAARTWAPGAAASPRAG